jgi:hypothetical protein
MLWFPAQGSQRTLFSKKAIMSKKDGFGSVTQAVIIIVFTMSVELVDVQSSLADGRGTYCQARKVRSICHGVVQKNDLKGHQRDGEIEKCWVNLMNSHPIQELTDDMRTFVE